MANTAAVIAVVTSTLSVPQGATIEPPSRSDQQQQAPRPSIVTQLDLKPSAADLSALSSADILDRVGGILRAGHVGSPELVSGLERALSSPSATDAERYLAALYLAVGKPDRKISLKHLWTLRESDGAMRSPAPDLKLDEYQKGLLSDARKILAAIPREPDLKTRIMDKKATANANLQESLKEKTSQRVALVKIVARGGSATAPRHFSFFLSNLPAS